MSSKDKKIKTEGLTTQEYSLKYALPLESLIHQNNSVEENTELHSFEKKIPNDEQRTILKAYYDLNLLNTCLLYTSPSPRDRQKSRMPSSA